MSTPRFTVLLWITASLITGVVGPFSTFDTMPLAVRLLYWGSLIGAGLLLGETIKHLVARFETPHTLRADVLGSLVMAPLFGLAITVFNATVFGVAIPFANALLMNALMVLLVCFGVVLLRAYIRHLTAARDRMPEPKAQAPKDEIPDFLRDVDPEIGQSFKWIEADNHYLMVHAPAGSARILMRFRDAMKDLAQLPGLRVHRSYWVRIEAVVEVRPDGRRHVAVLNCGTEVPVSRSYLNDVEMAGLLRNDAA